MKSGWIFCDFGLNFLLSLVIVNELSNCQDDTFTFDRQPTSRLKRKESIEIESVVKGLEGEQGAPVEHLRLCDGSF